MDGYNMLLALQTPSILFSLTSLFDATTTLHPTQSEEISLSTRIFHLAISNTTFLLHTTGNQWNTIVNFPLTDILAQKPESNSDEFSSASERISLRVRVLDALGDKFLTGSCDVLASMLKSVLDLDHMRQGFHRIEEDRVRVSVLRLLFHLTGKDSTRIIAADPRFTNTVIGLLIAYVDKQSVISDHATSIGIALLSMSNLMESGRLSYSQLLTTCNTVISMASRMNDNGVRLACCKVCTCIIMTASQQHDVTDTQYRLLFDTIESSNTISLLAHSILTTSESGDYKDITIQLEGNFYGQPSQGYLDGVLSLLGLIAVGLRSDTVHTRVYSLAGAVCKAILSAVSNTYHVHISSW
jgi:hypothetical protein